MVDSASDDVTDGTTVLVLNGPNLNLLGRREPEIYGSTTLDDIIEELERVAGNSGCRIRHVQANAEGAMIDAIHDAMAWADGMLVNPAGYTTTSVALRDAILASELPAVELHLSNIHARERFRQRSMLAGVCVGTVAGFGPASYRLALLGLVDHLNRSSP